MSGKIPAEISTPTLSLPLWELISLALPDVRGSHNYSPNPEIFLETYLAPGTKGDSNYPQPKCIRYTGAAILRGHLTKTN